MITTTNKLRVRYAETDQMGVVYHANYAIYFEVGRTEMFRQIGLPYAKMEENGIMLPLIDLHCNYKQSAKYDDELTIVTTLEEMPNVKIKFNYKIYNEEGTLLCDGYTTLVFIDTKRNRPTKMPDYIRELIEPHFKFKKES